jgi:hypothetical protein
MTQQELIQQIRAKNPQFSALPDNALVDFAIKQKPELKKQVTDLNLVTPKQQRTEEAKGLINDIQNQQPKKDEGFWHPLGQMGIGFLKGAGRSFVDAAKSGDLVETVMNPMQAITNKITGQKTFTQQMREKALNSYPVKQLEKTLEPKNKEQKIGGYAETAAELLVPAGFIGKAMKAERPLNIAKKALTMDTKELAGLAEKQFKNIFGINKSELETVGGVVTKEVKKMPQKLNELAVEFKEVLKSKNPFKNLQNVKKTRQELGKQTMGLFEGDNRILNEKTIRSYLTKTLEEATSFDSPFQKKEIISKTIEPFMKEVKQGTLKGLEEARAKFRFKGQDTTGKLKPAFNTLHKAIKNVIKENLPEEKKKIYDIIKTKQAKLYNIEEILKAKNKLVSGTSKAKELGKKALTAGGVVGSLYFLKNMFK